jgi:hypothetical protein
MDVIGRVESVMDTNNSAGAVFAEPLVVGVIVERFSCLITHQTTAFEALS